MHVARIALKPYGTNTNLWFVHAIGYGAQLRGVQLSLTRSAGFSLCDDSGIFVECSGRDGGFRRYSFEGTHPLNGGFGTEEFAGGDEPTQHVRMLGPAAALVALGFIMADWYGEI